MACGTAEIQTDAETGGWCQPGIQRDLDRYFRLSAHSVERIKRKNVLMSANTRTDEDNAFYQPCHDADDALV